MNLLQQLHRLGLAAPFTRMYRQLSDIQSSINCKGYDLVCLVFRKGTPNKAAHDVNSIFGCTRRPWEKHGLAVAQAVSGSLNDNASMDGV